VIGEVDCGTSLHDRVAVRLLEGWVGAQGVRPGGQVAELVIVAYVVDGWASTDWTDGLDGRIERNKIGVSRQTGSEELDPGAIERVVLRGVGGRGRSGVPAMTVLRCGVPTFSSRAASSSG
jgi:hypothetical protein